VGRGGSLAQHEALRELVAGLNYATERRERARRGTPDFRNAEAVQRRYREILLDDDLFERFLSGDPALEKGLPLRPNAHGRRDARQHAMSPRDPGRLPRRVAP